MKTLHHLIAAGLLLGAGLLTGRAQAQIIVPGLSGYNRLSLPGNSDSFVSLPFARPDSASGLALSGSGSIITFNSGSTPAWQTNQFVHAEGTINDTFYLLVRSGTKEGGLYLITGNTANTVTVELNGDTLAGLGAGDKLSIIPFWTLATLFPGGRGVNASTSPGIRQTEVLFPDPNATGVNVSAGSIFYFYNGNWFQVGQGTAIKDNEIIWPDSCIIVRHNTAASTELLCSGGIVADKLLVPLGVNTSAKRDNLLGLQRPTNVALAASGLASSGAFAASPTPGNRTDELLVFDNTVVGQNKSATAVYYFWNNAWRKVGAGSTVFDNAAVLTPGAGFVIRKNASAALPLWSNSPNY